MKLLEHYKIFHKLKSKPTLYYYLIKRLIETKLFKILLSMYYQYVSDKILVNINLGMNSFLRS